MDKRLKLEHSYLLFFAYSNLNQNQEDNEITNKEWLEYFEEVKLNPKLSKHVEIIMVK